MQEKLENVRSLTGTVAVSIIPYFMPHLFIIPTLLWVGHSKNFGMAQNSLERAKTF